MKNLCAFILAIIYLGFSIGATLNQHYCMGKLVGTSLFDPGGNECVKCGMQKHTGESKGCCTDISIVIKASDSHTFSQTVYDIRAFAYIIPATQFINTSINVSSAQTENVFRAQGPPLLKNPLFIQFRNLRI